MSLDVSTTNDVSSHFSCLVVSTTSENFDDTFCSRFLHQCCVCFDLFHEQSESSKLIPRSVTTLNLHEINKRGLHRIHSKPSNNGNGDAAVNEKTTCRPVCFECLQSHLSSKVMSPKINCISPECKESLTLDMIRDQWLPKAGEKFTGPLKAVMKRIEAAEADRLMESSRDPNLIDAEALEWIKKHGQRCPKCSHGVEKIDGCDYITCKCGCGFCYRCGNVMIVHVATHDCPKT